MYIEIIYIYIHTSFTFMNGVRFPIAAWRTNRCKCWCECHRCNPKLETAQKVGAKNEKKKNNATSKNTPWRKWLTFKWWPKMVERNSSDKIPPKVAALAQSKAEPKKIVKPTLLRLKNEMSSSDSMLLSDISYIPVQKLVELEQKNVSSLVQSVSLSVRWQKVGRKTSLF